MGWINDFYNLGIVWGINNYNYRWFVPLKRSIVFLFVINSKHLCKQIFRDPHWWWKSKLQFNLKCQLLLCQLFIKYIVCYSINVPVVIKVISLLARVHMIWRILIKWTKSARIAERVSCRNPVFTKGLCIWAMRFTWLLWWFISYFSPSFFPNIWITSW